MCISLCRDSLIKSKRAIRLIYVTDKSNKYLESHNALVFSTYSNDSETPVLPTEVHSTEILPTFIIIETNTLKCI